MRRVLVVLLTIAVGVVSALAVVAIRDVGSHTGPTVATPAIVRPLADASASAAVGSGSSCKGGEQVGIVTDNLGQFEAATKIYPSVTVQYLSWGSAFPGSIILGNHGGGVETQIVLEPRKVSMRTLADGGYDKYIASWATADKKLGLPIILSFAPEANGSWYSWGKGHISPSLYKAAWRHLHSTMYKDGARKITWMWQVNVVFPTSEPLRELWPGASYVNLVGVDGHLRKGNTFSSMFGTTLSEVRRITSRPVAISELADDASSSRVAQINEIFSALCTDKLVRFIWFDIKSKKANYQLEGDAKAIKVFLRDYAKLES